MKNGLIVFAVIFLIAGCDSKKETKYSGVVHSKNNYTQAGTDYLKKGQIKEAIASFEQAIKQEPRNPQNYITLGQIYLHLKNPEVAAQVFTVAVNVDAGNAEAFYMLGLSQGLSGQKEAAVQSLKRSSELYLKQKDEGHLRQALILMKSLEQGDQEPADMAKNPEEVLGKSGMLGQ